MGNDFSTSLKELLVDFLEPLDEAAADPNALTEFLSTLGYTSAIAGDPALLQIARHGQTLLAKLQAFHDQTLKSTDGLVSLLATAREAGAILQELRAFGSDPARTHVASGLADEVMSLLLASHLRRHHPAVFRIASLLTLIETKELAAVDAPVLDGDGNALRYGRVLDRFKFAAIDALVRQPGATLKAAYLPNGVAAGGDAWLAAQRLFPNLSLLADVLGLSSSTEFRPNVALPAPNPDDDDAIVDNEPIGDSIDFPSDTIDDSGGEVLSPLPPVPDAYFAANDPVLQLTIADAGATSGLALQILAASKKHPRGVAGLVLELVGTFNRTETRGPWKLTLSSSGAIPSLAFGPNGLTLGPSAGVPASGEARFVVERVPPPGSTGPAFVFGSPNGTRLELGSLGITGDVSFDGSGWSASLGVAAKSGALVITTSDTDSFLSSLLPSGGLRAPFDLGLAWSNGNGLTLRGSVGLDADIPIGLTLGPVTLTSVHVGLQTQASGAVSAEVSANLIGKIGPLQASVGRLGLTSGVSFPQNGGNLGAADLSLGFKPPTQIGLSIDVASVVSGSGFLYYDAAQGTYAGGMQLALHDSITLTALGLITTRLPDGERGYSLLIFITAEGFQPIQLGLGFTLTAIGGIVGVNRTFDEAVLRAGLKDDTLATLLFPRDPAANATAIVRSLASAFPAKAGSYLLGLLARICWGTPTLIQFDVALIMELGARTRLLTLGRVTALLPSPDNDLVRLKLDAMGVLDFDAGTIALDAALVDSRVAHKFAISGGGAFRAGWGSGPGSAFVLAIGGFNPRFVPPAGVPALDRVTIALSAGANPQLTCEAYFALTSNTLQFGARAQLVASAGGFTLLGDVGFDVLMTSLSHFVADFHASIQLKRGSHNLFKVAVEGTLEGVRPLRLSGKATFEILWCDFTVRFHATLVSGSPPTVATVDVLPLLAAALGTASNWRTVRPATPHGVALRALPAGTARGLVVEPLGRLEVTQSVVPLETGRDIDVVGGARVEGSARRFSLGATLAGGGGTTTTPVSGQFAPGQYFAMSDDEKLASPSFEAMQAGLAVGSTGVVTDLSATGLVAATVSYTALVFDGPELTPVGVAVPHDLPAGRLSQHVSTGAAARAPVRRVGRARFGTDAAPAVRVAPMRWSIVPLAGGSPASQAAVGAATTWSERRAVLDALNQGGVQWQLVPDYEIAQ